MTPVCPFIRAAQRGEISIQKQNESQNEQLDGLENKPIKESGEPAILPSKCPFGYKQQDGSENDHKQEPGEHGAVSSKCPSGHTRKASSQNKSKQEAGAGIVLPKCPLGFDSQTFKLGPLSCMVCQALLYDSSRCVPCSHVFCKVCISHFKDCPLCGADIEKIEADTNLQTTVDRFIEGHARIKRSRVNTEQEGIGERKAVIYEDISLERGSFLVHHAMRAFRANNIESAKSRLSICVEDIQERVKTLGYTSELCSQLGAVLGMLGDCCRATGDAASAVNYFEESVNFLLKVPKDDLEITHTLSVSLNKIGDLKYYGEDLQAARAYYFQALEIRRNAIRQHSLPSQIIDVAVSLAKVADVDRNLGMEKTATEGFQEAIEMLQSMKLNHEEADLDQRVRGRPILCIPVQDGGAGFDYLLQRPGTSSLFILDSNVSSDGTRSTIEKDCELNVLDFLYNNSHQLTSGVKFKNQGYVVDLTSEFQLDGIKVDLDSTIQTAIIDVSKKYPKDLSLKPEGVEKQVFVFCVATGGTLSFTEFERIKLLEKMLEEKPRLQQQRQMLGYYILYNVKEHYASMSLHLCISAVKYMWKKMEVTKLKVQQSAKYWEGRGARMKILRARWLFRGEIC